MCRLIRLILCSLAFSSQHFVQCFFFFLLPIVVLFLLLLLLLLGYCTSPIPKL